MDNILTFELADIDLEGQKLEAIAQLNSWRRKMFAVIEQTYSIRLREVETIVCDLRQKIDETRARLETMNNAHDHPSLLQLQADIDRLERCVNIDETIPKDLHQIIDRTVHVQHDGFVIVPSVTHDDDNNVLVLVTTPVEHPQSNVSKILHSEPVQQALAAGLTTTLTHVGCLAAANPATIAAATVMKTGLLTMGQYAMGATKILWSFVH